MPTAFDPEALERGAKALREISASPNAKKVRGVACRCTRAPGAHACTMCSCGVAVPIGRTHASDVAPRTCGLGPRVPFQPSRAALGSGR
jgi:hypothetical protein